MTTSKDKSIEVLGQERRRRWSVSVVARRDGINPNQLFHWRKFYQDGNLSAVSAGEAVVPASELADALKQICELQRIEPPRVSRRQQPSILLKSGSGRFVWCLSIRTSTSRSGRRSIPSLSGTKYL